MDRSPQKASANRHPWLKLFTVLFLLGLAMWMLREPLMRGVGDFLIETDEDCHGDVMYVLGGAPFDRGNAAAQLIRYGCVTKAYCTGSNIQQAEKAMGRTITEADLTVAAAVRSRGGVDPARILPFRYGTSTQEEAEGALHHAMGLGVDTIVVLSTEFHTRRVGQVFRKRFEGSGITVKVLAAKSTEYDPNAWWKSEQGLLMVNNEYVKTLYYAFKY